MNGGGGGVSVKCSCSSAELVTPADHRVTNLLSIRYMMVKFPNAKSAFDGSQSHPVTHCWLTEGQP